MKNLGLNFSVLFGLGRDPGDRTHEPGERGGGNTGGGDKGGKDDSRGVDREPGELGKWSESQLPDIMPDTPTPTPEPRPDTR